jgi:peptide/nickel transport system substrate-binding protein
MQKKKLYIVIAVLVVVMLVGSGLILATQTPVANRSTLVAAIGADVQNWYLDQGVEGDARYVWAQVYDTLVRYDNNLNLISGLAASWYSPDGGATWIFNLTQGIRFHDGSDFVASAVLFSYSEASYGRRTMLAGIDNISAIDPYTVQFKMAEATPLPYYLTNIAWPVMSPAMANASGGWNGKVIGSGPFRLLSQVADQEVQLERNPLYWGTRPYLSGVTFKVVKDANVRLAALRSANVDMIFRVAESDAGSLSRISGIKVDQALITLTDFLQFNAKQDNSNLSSSVFQDVNLRKAVAYSIDTQSLVANLLDGRGIAAKGRPLSPVMLYVDASLSAYAKNLTVAKALIEGAGYTMSEDGYYYLDGVRLSMTLMTNAQDIYAARFGAMADSIALQLKDAGVFVQVDKVPAASFSAREAAGNFSALLRTGFYVWGNYPRHFLIHDSLDPYSHYENATYDALVAAADASSGEQRVQLYHGLQQAVCSDLPAFYLVNEYKILGYRDYVKGFAISKEDSWLDLRGVSLKTV